jgi:uncharacterized protein (DUF58 family)
VKKLKDFYKSFYFAQRFFVLGLALIFLFVVAFVFSVLLPIAKLLFTGLALVVFADLILLYLKPQGIFARRYVADRLSNGDVNPVSIHLENFYFFNVSLEIIDEIPIQFQKRDLLFRVSLAAHQTQVLHYELRPTKRGEYNFGAVNVFVASPLGILQRRYQFSQGVNVAVYPSFMQMRQYEFMAISNRLTDLGIKKIRRLGHSMEFEQIRQYVLGDDIRAVNWKASARRNDLMVNAFQDEKSQSIYCLIDKGRVMKMPFEELSLLDYAINATLVLSNIALYKQDKAGLVTFSDKFGQMVLADKRPGQLQRIMDTLYKQKTRYLEPDYENLYAQVKKYVKQRSLLLLFTNFETLSSMQRQLPFFRRLAKEHLLVVVFFENTELRTLLDKPATTTEEIYQKIIAEKYFYEKYQIVKALAQYGIQSLLTPPQELTVNAINKYLEMKSRGMI